MSLRFCWSSSSWPTRCVTRTCWNRGWPVVPGRQAVGTPRTRLVHRDRGEPSGRYRQPCSAPHKFGKAEGDKQPRQGHQTQRLWICRRRILLPQAHGSFQETVSQASVPQISALRQKTYR